MPLLDHFHPPLAPRRHWESFHVNWAGAIADALNESLGRPLPVLPLALNAEIVLPIDLESTYTFACQRRRLT